MNPKLNVIDCWSVFDQLKIHLQLRRNMTKVEDAIKPTTEVQRNHQSWYEVILARAKAKHKSGNLDESLHDLAEAVLVIQKSRELHKMLIDLKEDIKTRSDQWPLIVISRVIIMSPIVADLQALMD